MPVIIDEELIEWFDSHEENFKKTRALANSEYGYNFDVEESIEDSISAFRTLLCAKIKKEKNPFSNQIEKADIRALGYGSIFEFVKKQIAPSIAEFIPGEREAFVRLRDEILEAKESVQTTRLANQSIVTGERANDDVQTDFMDALISTSKKSSVTTFDRIISNNNPKKWFDIFEFLMNAGDSARIFIRKQSYYMGFELVVIDRKISFIHFHNMSIAGDTNSNGTENNKYNQVVNSTLKIADKNVSEKLSDIFSRMHHRDFDAVNPVDCSRTLIGIPKSMENKKVLPVKFQNHGFLCCSDIITKPNHNDTSISTIRRNEVLNYLFKAFESWYNDMEDHCEDKINMALGISMLDEKISFKILENFETFFEKELESRDTELIKQINELKETITDLHPESRIPWKKGRNTPL